MPTFRVPLKELGEVIELDELLFGIVGADLSLSVSPQLHGLVFSRLGVNAVYVRFQIAPDEFSREFPKIMSGAQGLNVTAPYKVACLKFLKDLSREADEVGAANVVWNGKGYNTDYSALYSLLAERLRQARGSCAVVGAGGAARAGAAAAARLGFSLKTYDRDPSKAAGLCDRLNLKGLGCEGWGSLGEFQKSCPDCVINAVPPLVMPSCTPEVFVDFSYLRRAELGRSVNVDGKEILVRQALMSDSIWLDIKTSDLEEEVMELARKLLRRGAQDHDVRREPWRGRRGCHRRSPLWFALERRGLDVGAGGQKAWEEAGLPEDGTGHPEDSLWDLQG